MRLAFAFSMVLLSTSTAAAQSHTVHSTHSEPRWELGGAFGHFWQDNERDGDDLSLVGRYRLSRVLRLELELGSIEFDAAGASDRLGGALLLDIGGSNRVQPYLSLGLGALTPDVGDARSYGEVGGGLEFSITPRISIAGDVRIGGHLADDVSVEKITDGDTRFARWRAMALVRF